LRLNRNFVGFDIQAFGPVDTLVDGLEASYKESRRGRWIGALRHQFIGRSIAQGSAHEAAVWSHITLDSPRPRVAGDGCFVAYAVADALSIVWWDSHKRLTTRCPLLTPRRSTWSSV